MTIYILCEGPTEETFINRVLAPRFCESGTYLVPIIYTTKRTPTGNYRGGLRNYARLKKQILSLCRDHPREFVTTFIDYYGLPDTSAMDVRGGDLYDKICALEKSVENDVQMPNFICYLSVHEFEGLLFSDADAFSAVMSDKAVACIRKIRASFENPEFINNSYHTAPSKRIMSIYPQYKKIVDGNRIAEQIGLNRMLEECPHFRAWVEKLRTIVNRIT